MTYTMLHPCKKCKKNLMLYDAYISIEDDRVWVNIDGYCALCDEIWSWQYSLECIAITAYKMLHKEITDKFGFDIVGGDGDEKAKA